MAPTVTWIARGLAALALLALAVLAGAEAYLRASLPQTSGTVRLKGLAAEVEIIRDRNGVPHIFAAQAADAWFALGFVHAQDRFGQMEMMRLTGQGRLSEVTGPAAIDSDRFMRLLGLAAQAEASLAALSPASRAGLDAYAAGVNAFLDNRPGPLPPEFLVLFGHRPEPWQPYHSLLWGRLMALQLSGNWRDEITRARLAQRWPPEMIAQLWPEWPDDGATTLRELAELGRGLAWDRLAGALAPVGPAQASNQWVIAGRHTASGKPILVNDPHLALGAPGHWYLARLSAPGLELVGATAPGVPSVVLGHNRRIAWGLTTTNADIHDLFIERLDPADPDRYLTPEGWRPFATRRETIKVKGKSDVELVVRSTRHGVVISDVSLAAAVVAPAQVVALASPAYYASDRTAEALMGVNRARDWDEFVAALRDWHEPMQNIVYADIDGNIGFYSPARLPRRKSGDGWLPRPGDTGAFDWDGFVPFEALPHAFNPAAGRIVNANNRLVPADYPVFIGRDWDAPYRALRIAEILDATPRADIPGMAAILADPVSLFAREILARLDGLAPRHAASRRGLAMLAAWDGTMARERPEPLIFSAWMRALARALLGVDIDAGSLLFRERPAMLHAAFAGTSLFCDELRTAEVETCATRIEAALAQAIDELSDRYGADMSRWRWGDAHYAPFRHAVFSRLPVVRDLVGFRVATHGDYFTINRGAARGSDVEPFAHVHGAGLRAIYDLADLDASRFMVAPGQSGHPRSRHWGDLAQRWADGEHFTIAGDRASLGAAGYDVLTLAPR
ncbi:MAG: penicillin acylase family protein [Pseudomonadota bacterium]